MPLIDRTIYQYVNNNISPQILEKNFTPTNDEIEFAYNCTRNPKTSLCFLITLKIFQYTGYFIKVFDCPTKIRHHITTKCKIESLTEDNMHAYDMSKQSRRHQETILEYLEIKPYKKQIALEITKNIAKAKDVQLDIINCIIEELLRQQYELPTFKELECIADQARTNINDSYYESICNNLSKKQVSIIKKQILITGPDGKSVWNTLKDEPDRPTIRTLHEFVEHYTWLKSIDISNKVFKDVPMVKLDRFYAEAISLDFYRIKRMRKNKRIALVAITIRKMAARALDDLSYMVMKIMREAEELGRQKLLLYKAGQFEFTDELVTTFKKILKAYKSKPDNKTKIQAIEKLLGENTDYFLEKCDDYEVYAKKDHLPFMLQKYSYLRKDLLSCLEVLDLNSATTENNIEIAIKLIRHHANDALESISIKEFKSKKLELTWFSPKWRKFVMQDKNNIDKKKFELFVFTQIASQLKTKDLFVTGSERFVDYTNALMPWKEYDKHIKHYGVVVNKPTEPDAFVVFMQNKLEIACENADLAFNGKVNAKIKKGKIYLEKIVAKPLPKNFGAIEQLIDENLKQVTLLDIIAHVARSLHFADIIKPISGHDPKIDDLLEHIIAALFCYGCNIGATEAAKSIRTISRKQISWIDAGYITEEVLDKCIQLVIDYYNKFKLPKFWGDGEHVSVDGTLMEMYQRNLMAKFSARHGRSGGMGYYHISDTYIALFSNFISCGVYEALYIIEGILKNESEIQPKYVHGDTHSQSLAIFALMYLLGVELMPRIKGIKKLKFYKAKKEHKYIHLNELLTETIDWELIQKYVKDMFRIAMSIKEGNINANIIIEKICAREPKNQIYYAFTELGKVIRTCFLLEYICDFDLRKIVHASTCKSEEFNEYRDWVAFISSIIKSNDRIKQRKFIKYNHLVTNMVALYNVQDMSVVINELKHQGYDISDEILERLGPYRKKNITRIGALDLNMERIQKHLRPMNYAVGL